MAEKTDDNHNNLAGHVDTDQSTEDHAYATGPTSVDGIVADDLPGEGRGGVETDPAKILARKLPQKTGETDAGFTGLRADPDLAAADEDGGRGEN